MFALEWFSTPPRCRSGLTFGETSRFEDLCKCNACLGWWGFTLLVALTPGKSIKSGIKTVEDPVLSTVFTVLIMLC